MSAEWTKEGLNVHTNDDSLVCYLWVAVPVGVWVPVAGDLRFCVTEGIFSTASRCPPGSGEMVHPAEPDTGPGFSCSDVEKAGTDTAHHQCMYGGWDIRWRDGGKRKNVATQKEQSEERCRAGDAEGKARQWCRKAGHRKPGANAELSGAICEGLSPTPTTELEGAEMGSGLSQGPGGLGCVGWGPGAALCGSLGFWLLSQALLTRTRGSGIGKERGGERRGEGKL